MSIDYKKAIELTIKSLEEGWGAKCSKKDFEDFRDLPKTPRAYRMWLNSRCQSCRAEEVVSFLKKHKHYVEEEAAPAAQTHET